jgi:hypothetical protein
MYLDSNDTEFIFIDLCELQLQDAEQIEKQPLNVLKSNRIT